jgi:hypothetical protein
MAQRCRAVRLARHRHVTAEELRDAGIDACERTDPEIGFMVSPLCRSRSGRGADAAEGRRSGDRRYAPLRRCRSLARRAIAVDAHHRHGRPLRAGRLLDHRQERMPRVGKRSDDRWRPIHAPAGQSRMPRPPPTRRSTRRPTSTGPMDLRVGANPLGSRVVALPGRLVWGGDAQPVCGPHRIPVTGRATGEVIRRWR